MAVKSVFPHCVRTMHILPNLVTNKPGCMGIQIATKRVFGCTVKKFSALIPGHFVINYKFKGISIIIYVFLA